MWFVRAVEMDPQGRPEGRGPAGTYVVLPADYGSFKEPMEPLGVLPSPQVIRSTVRDSRNSVAPVFADGNHSKCKKKNMINSQL